MTHTRAVLVLLALCAAAPTSARAAAAAKPHARPGPPSVLPFVQDNYPKALADARARKVPLVVEAWAPW
ncbi:MAG TPA: hypothetical protein VMS93_01310 [Candidatus Saccharimonadales bacterium]|nr:hypothetical protein [Candidatus Saccharimonadales bacterium]